MTRTLLYCLIVASTGIVSCYAAQDTPVKPPEVKPKQFVHESEIDIASIKLTVTEEYTGVQFNGHPYSVEHITCHNPLVKKDGKPFIFFRAYRSDVGCAKTEDISRQDFDQAKTTPNAKRYIKEGYFAYLKGAQKDDSSVKSGWVATCSTSHNGQKSYKSSCQRHLCYSPEVGYIRSCF